MCSVAERILRTDFECAARREVVGHDDVLHIRRRQHPGVDDRHDDVVARIPARQKGLGAEQDVLRQVRCVEAFDPRIRRDVDDLRIARCGTKRARRQFRDEEVGRRRRGDGGRRLRTMEPLRDARSRRGGHLDQGADRRSRRVLKPITQRTIELRRCARSIRKNQERCRRQDECGCRGAQSGHGASHSRKAHTAEHA